ncbi:serine/threonine-protein kinase [Polyangium fumosum]|uniref:non-specific serine/threonine protein kinase n=1 Tax=Polyangium fumosum TaxID=889272 RepID=A0A4U1JA39_9BACT|nr:serine/threonine-protein kinase [Polyangium fumosum]TKD05300.1 serine/threonine-protein kinase PknK [Polyangium fumosum]
MNHPGDVIGPYRLLHPIGSGGMGQVFAAVHEHMDQDVALKLLAPAAAAEPQLIARFIQEARALARLEHPGIVRVLHCDRLDDGRVYLAMEHLVGVSLREWLNCASAPPALGAALALARQIADAMVEVHAAAIVHRDLKPENVFLCPEENTAPGHRVKILDFGIAKVPPKQDGASIDTQVQTNAPVILGTSTYMAPEQWRDPAEVDGRADVYALGVMLFELCAGRPPFVAEDRVDLITMHMRDEPPSLQDLAPAVPGPLAAFVASMLAKDPAERPTMARCREMLGLPWETEREECPIPGLAPFTETQAELFFGRSAEIAALVDLLEASRAGERRWVQIEGPSGVGKSSLVQAGLLPRLKEHAGTSRWRVLSLRPSYDSLRSLAEGIVTAFTPEGLSRSPDDIERSLREDNGALDALLTAHAPPGCCVLLVIEQLEELFTIGTAGCRRLDEVVDAALAAPASSLRLLTTLRSDFLHRLDEAPRFARRLNQASRHHLGAMEEAALTQVIQGMARRAGMRLANGLAERMVRDARSAGSQLPLLGHALRALWSRRGGALVSHEHYEALGGVGGALMQQAERLLDALGDEGRERAKWLLLDLVQVGRGVPDTRRPRTRQEVLASAGGDKLAEEVLMRLSGARAGAIEALESLRLVVLSSEPDPARQCVELIHESLLQQVPTVAGWIEGERARLERHADLEALAHAWEQAGGPSTGLPSGTLLAHYRGAEAQHRLARMASARALRFLDAAERLARRRSRVTRALAAILLAAVMAIAGSAIFAWRERQRAEENLQSVLSATDDIVGDVDWTLGRHPHTLDVRRKMLLDIEERLLRLPEQDRPEVRAAIISTKHRRSDLARNDETLAQADILLVDAVQRIRDGLTRAPSDTALLELLGLNLSKRGKIALARGQYEAAQASFAEALDLFARLRPSDDAEDARRTMATSYAEQAELELALGRAGVAGPLYERAVVLLEQNDSDYDRGELALTLCGRGEAARKALDPKAAGGYLDRALALQTEVVEAEPGNAYFRWILSRIHVELAALRRAEGAREAAAKHLVKARDLAREVHQGEPTNKNYALVLLQSLREEEELTLAQGGTSDTTRLRAERCALAAAFARADSEDVRFQSLVCP